MNVVALRLTKPAVLAHIVKTLSRAETAFQGAPTPTPRALRLAIEIIRTGAALELERRNGQIIGAQAIFTGLSAVVQPRERRVWRVIDMALDIVRDAINSTSDPDLAEAMQNAIFVASEMDKALPSTQDLKGAQPS